MSSSGGALARSRSLRKPAVTSRPDAESTTSALPSPADDSNGDGQLRNVSPSRLPVKGMGAVSSRPPPARTAGAVGVAARSNTSRPLSGVFGRMTASSTRGRAPDNETLPSSGPDTAAAAAAAAAAATTTTSRPPRTTRPVPTQRPTSSSGVPAASATRARVASSHSRTKSTSTSISTSTSTSVTSLTGATTLRPPSATSHVSAPLATAGTDRSRPPQTSNTRAGGPLHRRQVSATSNSSYASSTTTATSASAATTAATGALSDHRANTSAAAAASNSSSSSINPAARPAFTTLQQHYSPAKSLAPKPLTASFLAPPSPSKLPANVAASAETSRLQTELLQLHLLHRSAGPVAGQWRASARHKLAGRFDRLVRAADDVARLDAGAAERRNVRALLAWQGQGQGHGQAPGDFPPSLLGAASGEKTATGATLLEHKIQTLDAVLTGLWAVAEPGGRYARVVRRFERWAERVDALAELRRALASNSENHPAAAAAAALTGDNNGSGSGSGEGDELAVLAGELDAAWKDECAGLVRRLDEWRRMLRGELAGHDDDGLLSTAEREEGEEESGSEGSSSLHRILAACRVLVADMLAELHAMDRIERDAVAAENAWVRAMNRDGEDDSPPASARAGALWRVL